MTIPNFQEIMLPLLEFLGDKQEHPFREAAESLAGKFNLTTPERNETISSGQLLFDNRVSWALIYTKKAGLIENSRRSYLRITEKGYQILKQKPEKVDIKFLKQFKEFQEFLRPIAKREKTEETNKGKDDTSKTPEEALADAYQNLNNKLASDLLEQLKSSSSKQFENTVIDLLVAMGYGGSRREAAQVIGKSGDEGIDGVINEDRLGLDVIYIQAKKWDSTIGRPEIQKFAGALQGQHAKKGIFITSADFSQGAIDFASRVDNKIILIDGNALVQHMIDHNIGVTPTINYEIKKVDLDYFTEE